MSRFMIKRIVLALALVGTTGNLAGCGGAPEKPKMQPGPAIPGLNLNGLWYSQEFGDMKLIQSGDTVQGSYQNPRGPEYDGTLRGKINGDLLRIDWIEPGDTARAIFPKRGKAVFRITHAGTKLQGTWGYDQAEEGGGRWNAQKSQQQ
ncbi:MAG: hypothetical protein ACE366_10490 [Bradymonadia bacterium]